VSFSRRAMVRRKIYQKWRDLAFCSGFTRFARLRTKFGHLLGRPLQRAFTGVTQRSFCRARAPHLSSPRGKRLAGNPRRIRPTLAIHRILFSKMCALCLSHTPDYDFVPRSPRARRFTPTNSLRRARTTTPGLILPPGHASERTSDTSSPSGSPPRLPPRLPDEGLQSNRRRPERPRPPHRAA
jgi:hypothetical protein